MLSDKISGCRTRLSSSVAVLLMLLLFAGVGLASTASASNTNKDAQNLMASAEVLRANWSATELRHAKEKYEKAALTWTSISDYKNGSIAILKAGDVCVILSELHEALKLYQQAALLAQKGRDRRAQGRALSQIGLVYSHMGNNGLAKELITKALDLLRVAENNPDTTAKSFYGEALSNRAEVTYAEGYLPKALEQFKDAERFFTGDNAGQAKIHLFLGYIYGSLGATEQARSEFSQSLNLYREVSNKAGEGRAVSGLGLFHSSKGDQDQALRLHGEAIKIFHPIGDRLGEAFALNGSGQAYEKWKQLPSALQKYEEALQLFESVGALDFIAGLTFKLAIIHKDMGHHEKAHEYYQRCLTLSRAAKKDRNLANALSEIAIVYASQGRLDQASKQHRKAQEFYKSIGDWRGLATALNTYGDLLLSVGRKQLALDTYLEALALREKVGDMSIVLTTLYNLARAHEAVGEYDRGLDFIEQSIRIIEKLRAKVESPDARTSYFSGVRQYYDLCRDILMQLDRVHPGEDFATRAFFISEESRARALLDQVKESRANLRDGATADLLKREREITTSFQFVAQYQYDLSLTKRRDSDELAEVSTRLVQLRTEYQDIQAKLRAQSSTQLSAEQIAVKDLGEVQKELRVANAMLLEYSLGDQHSYLFAITSNSVQSFELPSRTTLEALTTEVYDLMIIRQKLDGGSGGDYQPIIEAADNCYPQKAAQLSQILLGPVTELLTTKRLVVVTEGALQYVQFEAMPVPQRGTIGPDVSETPPLLIQTNEIVRLPSMSTLMAIRAAPGRPALPGKIVAVIADPVFGPGDERVQNVELSPAIVHAAPAAKEDHDGLFRDGGPTRLVHASEEADAISEAAPWGTTLLATGFDANRETAMSPSIGEYHIVHFATHGFLDSEHPELSGIVLSMVDQNGGRKSGLMTLHDISSLDLSAELTVLSACQTALGKDIKGEGWIGLTHSFMSAGSKSVVASLWKVDDRATSILMSDFYNLMLREGLAPVAALRAAKLKMIQDKRWNQPYYWAGFVFQGDYQSRINVDGNSPLAISLVLLFSILISSGLIVLLRRRGRPSPA